VNPQLQRLQLWATCGNCGPPATLERSFELLQFNFVERPSLAHAVISGSSKGNQGVSVSQGTVIAARRTDGLFGWFERNKEVGPLFVRLWVGFHLIYGVQDNIFSWARMMEFREFLAQFGFPFPIVSAHVSVYAQFICGVLYILGLFTRQAAVVMIINFIVALGMVHVGDPYPRAALAFAMLAGSLFLLFHGPGRVSVDERRK